MSLFNWCFLPQSETIFKMRFNPADPFPLVNSTISYQEMQNHSLAVDQWLGLQVEKVEKDLADSGCRLRAQAASGEKQQLWIGLAPTSLLTPYIEIRYLLEILQLKAGSVVADLGAAFGRMGFVIGKAYPQLNFVGYEYVGERVREFDRCAALHKFSNVEMRHADLSSPQFQLQPADVYFIYDYGSPKAIRKTLYDLQRIAKRKTFHVVVRGLAAHREVETAHSWLTRSTASAPSGKSSIFRSQIVGQSLESVL